MADAVEYRDIPGFPGYRVGSDGSVWTAWERYYTPGAGRGVKYRVGESWHRVATEINRRGYVTVAIGTGGKSRRKRVFVHTLVLLAFVGPRPEGMECCHFPDPSPANNCLSNLRWDTPKANTADTDKLGRRLRGEQVPNARATVEMVRLIRLQFAQGETGRELARRHGLSRTGVRKILSRETWAHVGHEA